MLNKKTSEEINILREGGKILSQILSTVESRAKLGITGHELNKITEDLIKEAGGAPAFKNYQGFPCALCVSVNETVVHGIPNNLPFKEGDLVGLDMGMKYKGFYTDIASTVAIGQIREEVKQLLKATRESLFVGISQVSPDGYIGDIGRAIEAYISPWGYGIVRDLAGHGVGRDIHEDPMVPNYDSGKKLDKMFPGLVIAIEPMIIMGGNHKVIIGNDGWSINSQDSSLTAHFEHSVAVTETGYLILTE